jgi:hypothetical protein
MELAPLPAVSRIHILGLLTGKNLIAEKDRAMLLFKSSGSVDYLCFFLLLC